MIEDKFVQAVHAAFPAFKGELTRATSAAQVPGWDSFGHVQLLFELEDAYGITLNPAESLTCTNVGSLYDMVKATSGA